MIRPEVGDVGGRELRRLFQAAQDSLVMEDLEESRLRLGAELEGLSGTGRKAIVVSLRNLCADLGIVAPVKNSRDVVRVLVASACWYALFAELTKGTIVGRAFREDLWERMDEIFRLRREDLFKVVVTLEGWDWGGNPVSPPQLTPPREDVMTVGAPRNVEPLLDRGGL